MIGFPKHLSTKTDYEYIRSHFPKEKWQPHFQALLDTKDNFFITKTIDEKGSLFESDTLKIIEQENINGIAEEFQAELQEDKNCKLLKIGFTVKDVEDALL